ncbi:MAG: pilus assembly protein N-terminal domain-containing protein [Planctomycetota bacterium]
MKLAHVRLHPVLFGACLMLASVVPATAQGPAGLTSEQTMVSRSITQRAEKMDMLVKSSRILKMQKSIPRFQVNNPALISATPIAEDQIQLFAKAPGSTQINLWDSDDNIYTVSLTVVPDASEVEGILQTQLPFASLRVLPINSSAVIYGSVTSVDDVDRAVAIAEQYYTSIINNIKVVGVQQVLLHTRIMEVSRTKLRDMGIDWGSIAGNSAFISSPGNLVNVATSDVNGLVPSAEASLLGTNRIVAGGTEFEALITALREQRLIKFLAEPTVVATHGRPARFNVGGRVPYFVPGGNGTVTVNYEEYGTAVDFLPFVVGPGRVRLEVRPEVTEPDDSRSISADGINVTAFSQRYVETAVELQAGQTFAIAGLLQSRIDASSRGTPLLGELPFVGSLFRRVQHERNEIELLITVTPELVAAMDPHEVPCGGPGLNSTSPNDHELFSLGHLEVPNQVGGCAPGTAGHPAAGGHAGGMIVPGMNPVDVGGGITISTPPPTETYYQAPAIDAAQGDIPAEGVMIAPMDLQSGSVSPSGVTPDSVVPGMTAPGNTAPGTIVEGY